VETNGFDADVGIIGGGPAGASMAGYLAKAGVETIVFERELFPRPHVGESLVPSSTRIFRELDFLPTMEAEKFPRKYGAAWTSANSNNEYQHDWQGLSPDNFAGVRFEEREQPGVDQLYTYHVDRGKFDNLLLQHANKLGAKVVEGVYVRRADFDEEGVTMRVAVGSKQFDFRVRMVVDASGRQTTIGKQMKWRVHDPIFDQYALHTWVGGYDRSRCSPDPALAGYIFIHFLPITNSWVWQIPITDEITSVGVVTQKKNFKGSRESREQFFWSSVGTRPELLEGLRAAEQIRPFKEEADYSYAIRQLADDRVVLVGDAARFVDPIFSTGVSIALSCSRFAHPHVIEALETGEFSRATFAPYEETIRRGHKNWYEFISVYYRLNVLFTAFVNDQRYRTDVLKLLQGDVYEDEEPSVLKRMKRMVKTVEETEDHVWHKLLGGLTAEEFRRLF
jgi:1H-pyrrole-2-carbonyl-[peptidyl-carrier protein] chlorinase